MGRVNKVGLVSVFAKISFQAYLQVADKCVYGGWCGLPVTAMSNINPSYIELSLGWVLSIVFVFLRSGKELL